MEHIVWLGEQVAALRIQLCHGNAEMVMDGCPFEDTLFLSFLLSSLEVFHLKDDREVFYQEDATKDRYQQFLVDDDSKYGNDATNGQAACISHKYLRREGIVPEEAD